MAKIVVIGAGIGGLTTGALLAQTGHQVTVLETNTYAGGSAGTFLHKGYHFDAGATVAGGFQPNGPHALVGEKLGITWPIHPAKTAWVVHLPDCSIPVTQTKAEILDIFPQSAPFWKEQEKLADIGWSFAAQGLPWPPANRAEWMQLIKLGLKNIPAGLQVLPYVFSTTYDWLKRNNLHEDKAFVRFLDGQLLISAQTTTRYANAIYSATALDLARQGVTHVAGGIGQLAQTLVEKIEALGGEVLFRRQVTGIKVEDGKAIGVEYRIGRRSQNSAILECDFVVANLTPRTLNNLLGTASPQSLQREVRNRDMGWGAFVLHIGIHADKMPDDIADHHQIITDWDSPLGEGKSIFLSMSPQWDTSRAPDGKRAVTITTHTDVNSWWEIFERDKEAYNARKEQYTEQILEAIERVLPDFRESVDLILPGSPVTYQYYTGREKGMVGGFPQTSLLKARSPQTGIGNMLLVGDSIFPGQSTAGVSVGAMRVADAVNYHLRN